MTLLEIRKALNSLLAGEMLTVAMMQQHVNFAIDEINTAMNTCFPSLDSTELTDEYTAIPDRYIRSVVLPGAAHHYYMVDDEGTTPEVDFARQFEIGKFYMLRDYSCQVPAEYQNEDLNIGSVESMYEDAMGKRGIEYGALPSRPTGIAILDAPLSWEGDLW